MSSVGWSSLAGIEHLYDVEATSQASHVNRAPAWDVMLHHLSASPVKGTLVQPPTYPLIIAPGLLGAPAGAGAVLGAPAGAVGAFLGGSYEVRALFGFHQKFLSLSKLDIEGGEE